MTEGTRVTRAAIKRHCLSISRNLAVVSLVSNLTSARVYRRCRDKLRLASARFGPELYFDLERSTLPLDDWETRLIIDEDHDRYAFMS